MADLMVGPTSAHSIAAPATETTPLLSDTSSDTTTINDDDINLTTLAWEEARALSWFALPVYGIHLLEYSFSIVAVIAVGHISTTALAAISLGSMTAGVTGLSIIQGFTSALDTLMPSAWTSDKPQLVGLWAQRMSVATCIVLVPVIAIWLNAESLLIALKQDPEVARLAAIYLQITTLGMPGYAFNCISRRYFMAQGLFSVPTQIITIVAPINVLLTYLLVWGPDQIRLGYIGAPIATCISYNLVSLLSLIYGVWFVPRTGWHPLTTRSFKSLGVVFRLGLADVAQTASEWWAWEIAGFMASFLGPAALAAHSVIVVTAATAFQAPYALSVATSIRVGNLLGSKNARRSHITANFSLVLSLGISFLLSFILITLRNSWAYIFNDDPEVVLLVARAIPLLAIFQMFDGNTAVTGGILRAQGKQFIGAVLNVASYYAIGLPLSAYLAFRTDLGLYGIWIGLTVALVFGSFCGSYLVLRSKWDVEVFKAHERIRKEQTGKVTSVLVDVA